MENPANTTNSLPGFYCKNKGHQPSYVSFSNVNDGICDYELCCDGSEEWEGIVKCQDKCAEIGKEWRKHDEARQRSLNAASKKRAELVTEAQRLRKAVEDRLQSLGTEIGAAEIKVKNMEQELKDVQRSEAGKTVKAGPGKGGKLSQLVELARTRMDELRNNLISTRGELSSNRDRLKQLEGLLATFKEEYNPNFNDEGVKRAVRAWEDYAASYTLGAEPNAATERDVAELIKEDSENGLDWESYVEEEGDTDVCEYYSIHHFCKSTPLTIYSILLHQLPPTLNPHLRRRETSRPSSSPHRQRNLGRYCCSIRNRDQESDRSPRTSQSR